MFKKIMGFITFLSLLSTGLIAKGTVETKEGHTILSVRGDSYEIGYQHGKLLKESVHLNIARLVDQRVLANQSQPLIKAFFDHLPTLISYVPTRFMEEMKGLANGADVPLEKIVLLNLFPEMVHCSGITVNGKAALNEELYHVRVLDYSVGQSIQDTAVTMVVQPNDSIPFLNITYAGFIGSITGMNASCIAIGQIGGKGYGFWEGIPMAFLLRDILERASSLEQVKEILEASSRTCEHYYLFSDGKTNQSFAAYATASQLHYINPGDSYALLSPSNLPSNYEQDGFNDKFFMLNYEIDQSSHQTVIYKDKEKKKIAALFHKQLQDCLLLTGYSCPSRYPILVDRLLEQYGKIGVRELQEVIKKPIALKDNLHNAIFHPRSLEVWISHAGPQNELACDRPYYHFSLIKLLNENQ